jgi:hypothetical protein
MRLTDLPLYLPLERAAEEYELAVERLHDAVTAGDVHAVKTTWGEVLVRSQDAGRVDLDSKLAKIDLDEELQKRPIRSTVAADKYGVSQRSLSNWAYNGLVSILERGPRLLVLDEAEVKQAAQVFLLAKERTGSYVVAGRALKRILSKEDGDGNGGAS